MLLNEAFKCVFNNAAKFSKDKKRVTSKEGYKGEFKNFVINA